MANDTVENLLGTIPTGDEVKDPRENDYEATLKDASIVEQKNGHSLKLVFGNIVDTNGKDFEHNERVTIPTSESEKFIQDIFIRWAHGLEVLPRSHRNAILADSEEHRGIVLEAFKSKLGEQFPLTIYSNNGYLRSRVSRKK
jgi:hypothetical protein